MIYRWITTGDPRTVEDQRNFETAKGVAQKLASVLLKMQQDRDAFLYAMWTGDDETTVAIGEEYRVVLELGAEMFETLLDEIDELPQYEQGKIYGRIIGEILITVAGTFATAGGALAAKGATMKTVAINLKQVALLQRFSSKFDDLIRHYDRLEDWTDGLDNVNDGKAIAQRSFSIILHKKAANEGHWPAFVRFMEGTSDPERRAIVDSQLGFVVNRIMKESYAEAAAVLRRGGTLAEAMQRVPNYTQAKQVLGGRLDVASLEVHHAATNEWMKRMLRTAHPGTYGGWPNGDPRWAGVLNEMPALVMDKAWHRVFNREWFEDIGMPENWTFHTILDAADSDPDVWFVTEAWIRRQLEPQ